MTVETMMRGPLGPILEQVFPSVPTPADQEPQALPAIGSFWAHKNGNIYEVVLFTNLASDRPDYPPCIVYRGRNGNIWSRPISAWDRSFTELVPPDPKTVELLLASIKNIQAI